MAYCSIHAIRSTVGAAVNYICNETKTEELFFIDSYDCAPETAAQEFAFSLSQTHHNDTVKAYHLIQSFLPGEVDASEGHRVGRELADRLLEGKYSYVIATHTDKKHIHNHIIFCAADNVDHKKYHACKKSYYHIRELSDQLCEEHHLSVIKKGQDHGKSYKEWLADREGSSWKSMVRKHINAAVKEAQSYEDFLRILKAKGYQIRGEDIQAASPKYISFLPPGKERWIRGKEQTLGAEYTREHIRDRIENRDLTDLMTFLRPERKDLIHISEEKLSESPNLARWAERENLQIASKAYTEIYRAGFKTMDDLEHYLTEKRGEIRALKERALAADHKMDKVKRIVEHAEQYTKNLPYKRRYDKVRDKEAYFRKHEAEISICEASARLLEQEGVKPAQADPDAFRRDYKMLKQEKEECMEIARALSGEIRDLERYQKALIEFLKGDREIPQRIRSRDQCL